MVFFVGQTFNVSYNDNYIFYSFLAAIVGTVLHLCINNSYKLADLSIIQPVWFTQLIFASLLGFIIFGSLPDLFTWIGASVIFLGVLIISYREMKLEKEIIRKSIDIKN